jgi:hypothetical protein
MEKRPVLPDFARKKTLIINRFRKKLTRVGAKQQDNNREIFRLYQGDSRRAEQANWRP